MAEQIILDIQLDKGSVNADLRATLESLKALKNEQKELTKAIKEGNDVDGEMSARLLDLKSQIKYTEAQAKGLSATQRVLTADGKKYEDTLNGQRQKLSDMQSAYDAMDKEMRESEGGKAFLSQIKEQHDAVLGLEGATGRMQRNVGNYGESIKGIIPSFDKFDAALNKMGTSMNDLQQGVGTASKSIVSHFATIGKALITPPLGIIVAILTGIMLIFGKLASAIKKNDDAMTNLQVAFSAFKPIAIAIGKIFEGIGVALSKVAVGIANVVTKISSALIPGFEEASKKVTEYILAVDALEETQRRYTVQNAKDAQEIAKYRAIAAESTDLEERKKALQSAIALEEEIARRNVEIATKTLQLRKEQARQEVDTTDETKNEIARLEAEKIQAETDYYNKKREMAAQIRELNNKINAENAKNHQEYIKRLEAQRKAEEEAEKARQEALKASLENEKALRQQMEDFKASLIKDAGERELVEMQIAGTREIEELKKRLETEKNITEEGRAILNQLIIDKQTELDTQLKEKADTLAEERINAEMQRIAEQEQTKLELRKAIAEENSAEMLELQLEELELQQQAELENTILNEEEKYLIVEKYEKLKQALVAETAKKNEEQATQMKMQLSASLQMMAKNASSAFGQMSELLEGYGEENEKGSKAAKAFALMQLSTDQAISISQTARAMVEAVQGATQAAASTGPLAPVMLAVYIAEMVGLVLGAVAGQVASIKQAKGILSGEKFESGGIVGGTSFSGDKVVAHVNSGEMILNREQQTRLFDMANLGGGFDYSGLAQALTQAVASLPSPTLQYQEFKDFQSSVQRVTKIAEL